MGGIGAAAGPLLGGLITATLGWRAAFGVQALIIVLIVLLARRIKDPLPGRPHPPLRHPGAVLSAAGTGPAGHRDPGHRHQRLGSRWP